MAHHLENKVAAIRRRAWLLSSIYGLACAVTVTLISAVVWGLADYWFRFQSAPLRVAGWSMLLMILGWSILHFIVPNLFRRYQNVDISRQIEKRFPDLRDRLTSSIEFLQQPNALAPANTNPGESVELRQALIQETSQLVEQFDFSAAIRYQPVTASVSFAATVCAICGALWMVDPAAAMRARERMLNPFVTRNWNHLEFVAPVKRIAEGQTFRVELADHSGRLPGEARLLIRYDNPTKISTTDSGDRTPVENETVAEEEIVVSREGETIVFVKKDVTRGFSYRATGGDDQTMEWIQLIVVPAPRVTSVTFTLHPPAYTTWSSTTFQWPQDISEPRFQALAKTRITIHARLSQPVKQVRLRFDQRDAIDAEISRTGKEFEITFERPESWTVHQSQNFRFELTDKNDFVSIGPARWHIGVVTDQRPVVFLDQPNRDLYVTSRARVPLLIRVIDDLNVRSVALAFERSDRPSVSSTIIPLYPQENQTPQSPAKSLLDVGQIGELTLSELGRREWDLSGLNLAAGTTIQFRIVARDNQPSGSETQSPTRRLNIVTPEELAGRITKQQAELNVQLRLALEKQSEVRGLISGILSRIEQRGRLTKGSADTLYLAQDLQQQVGQIIASPDNGVLVEVERLLVSITRNRLDKPDLIDRLKNQRRHLVEIANFHIPKVEHQLNSAYTQITANEWWPRLKDAVAYSELPTRFDRSGRLAKALEAAILHHDQMIESLSFLLAEMTDWNDLQRIRQSLIAIAAQQENAQRRSIEISNAFRQNGLHGMDYENLSPDDKRKLVNLSESQLRLAANLQSINSLIRQLYKKNKSGKPNTAHTLAAAERLLSNRLIIENMREASTMLGENRLLSATERQAAIVQDLRMILAIFERQKKAAGNDGGNDAPNNINTVRRQKQLAKLFASLQAVRASQAELTKESVGIAKLIASGDDLNSPQWAQRFELLSKRQAKLAKETARIKVAIRELISGPVGGTSR